MATINVKYKCGQEVRCHDIKGIITAIHVRGEGRTYEFSYLNSDGNPASVNAEECELSRDLINNVGFRSKKNG